MRLIIAFVLCLTLSYAKDYVYFLPEDSQKLQTHLEDLIEKSQINIDIAMYNFGSKKLAKLLKNAVKNGVEVSVIFDKKKVNTDKKIKYEYLKEKGIKTFIADKKMHLKMALFDNKTVMLGSLNWTKASFEDNYEIVYITESKKAVNKSKKIFKKLKEK